MAYRFFSPVEAPASYPVETVETVEHVSYYDNAHRVSRDGVPCRVFIKRDRELSRQIQCIEIARDAGCDLAMDDCPSFQFDPVERTPEHISQLSKGARPVPNASRDSYYKDHKRIVVCGVPCRIAGPLQPNHKPKETWADLREPMGGFEKWNERAQAWWESVCASRESEPEITPEIEQPIDQLEGDLSPIESDHETIEAPAPQEPLETSHEPDLPDFEPLEIAPDLWVLACGGVWFGRDGEFVFFNSLEEALEALEPDPDPDPDPDHEPALDEMELDCMTGDEMKSIRESAGLSLNSLADFLHYSDVDGLRKMEGGKKQISGPIQRVLELIRDGFVDEPLGDYQ